MAAPEQQHMAVAEELDTPEKLMQAMDRTLARLKKAQADEVRMFVGSADSTQQLLTKSGAALDAILEDGAATSSDHPPAGGETYVKFLDEAEQAEDQGE